MVGSSGETEIDGVKPVVEEEEAQAKVGQGKDPVQVEGTAELETEKLQTQPLGGDSGLEEEPAVSNQTPEDIDISPEVVDVRGDNVKLKSEGNGDIEMKDTDTQSLGETAVKMEDDDEAPVHENPTIDHSSCAKDDDDNNENVNGEQLKELSPEREDEDDALVEPPHDTAPCETPTIDDHSRHVKAEGDGNNNGDGEYLKELSTEREIKKLVSMPELGVVNPNLCFDNSGCGSEEEQAAFVKEVEAFYKENNLEFKHPKFYKEDLNLLKLWKAVIKLGGYEQVTSCKLWRQVGESFNPPKTCTTVSWTFRIFYEKALLEYEKHKLHGGELPGPDASFSEPNEVKSQNHVQAGTNQTPGSGRARRDAAARAMQGWHSQRVLGNGEVCHPIIKDRSSSPTSKADKQLKNFGLLKRKKPSNLEHVQSAQLKASKPQLDTRVIDIGPPADWVKINVQKTNDCFEVYALVPGFLREEVHVQSDPVGRLIISGQPKELDNPWGVTPFKKVVSLPFRIDPHQISAVVTLHGQLFVRVPFEHSDP